MRSRFLGFFSYLQPLGLSMAERSFSAGSEGDKPVREVVRTRLRQAVQAHDDPGSSEGYRPVQAGTGRADKSAVVEDLRVAAVASVAEPSRYGEAAWTQGNFKTLMLRRVR